MRYDFLNPVEFKGNPDYRRGVNLARPVMFFIKAEEGRNMEPLLNGLLCQLAGPLVAYLGLKGALKAADRLKACIKSARKLDN